MGSGAQPAHTSHQLHTHRHEERLPDETTREEGCVASAEPCLHALEKASRFVALLHCDGDEVVGGLGGLGAASWETPHQRVRVRRRLETHVPARRPHSQLTLCERLYRCGLGGSCRSGGGACGFDGCGRIVDI